MRGETRGASLGERLLDEAAAASGIIGRNLAEHRDAPLSVLLQALRADGRPGLQARDDLWEAIRAQATLYYGPEAAGEAVAALRAEAILSTSNHFGIDTLAVSAHCTMLFALRPQAGGDVPGTAVVLGCGSVSMDSQSYPMGLLLYEHRRGAPGRLVHRLAVVPNRLRRQTVGAAGPFDDEMVRRASERLRALRRSGEISAFCERAAAEVLEEDFGDGAVLALPTYRRQAVAVNHRLWSRMVRPPGVRVVQLELEEVTTAVLGSDLLDEASLVHRILFIRDARARLLAALDGVRGCWHLDGLRNRLAGPEATPAPSDGTTFFWGMNEEGRRIPLLVEERGSVPALLGVDGQGRRHEWAFVPDALAEALARGEIIPSLLTCFMVIAFARGIACVGGPNQAAYLPRMQRGIVEAVVPDDPDAAEAVVQVTSRLCLADMNLAMRVTEDGLGLPAGPVEIAGAGGIASSDLMRIPTSITVREAYLAAFPEVLPDIVPDTLPADWLDRLAAENTTSCPNVIRLGCDVPAFRSPS